MQRTTAGSLRLGFGGLVAFLLAAAVARFFMAEYMTNSFERTLAEIEAAREANTEVLQALTDVETGVRGYQLTGDRAFLEPATRGQLAFPKRMRDALGHAPDYRTRSLLATQRATAEEWLHVFANPVAVTPPSELRRDPAIQATGKRHFDEVRRANAAVGAGLDSAKRDALATVRRDHRITEAAAVALSLISILLVLYLALRTSRLLLSPLAGMRETLIRLSRGEHSARARELGPPEIRQVVRHLNEVCDESDRLRDGQQRRLHMQTLGHQIGGRVRESLDRSEVFDGVVDALGAALDVDRVYIQLIQDGRPAGIERQWHRPGLAALADDIPAMVAGPPSLAAGPARVPTEYHGKGLTACDDVTADPTVSERFVAATGSGAFLITTFGFDEEVFGEVVLIQVDTPRQWLPDEIALVDAVSADLGRAFEHVRLYEHERELVERLREVDEQKTNFIATVSHELRTPLTSVLGYLEVLTSGDQGTIPDRQMRSLRVIERNAERLGEMVADLLTLSRIHSGSFNLDVGSVRTSEVVAGALETLGPVAAGLDLRLDTDVPDDLWIAGDRRQLQRIIGNLVGNAIKFSSPGGAIRVDAAQEGTDWVRISVSDTGAGIPEQEQRHLFEPFQRGANAVARAAQGPGLGLAVVRSIVEQHRGRVELVSEVGLGTKVTVLLPRRAAEVRAEPAPSAVGTA